MRKLAALIVVAVAACSAASAVTPPFKVTSTLDGRTVLPSRIHWLAYPKVPEAKVAEVAFLVDGKVRWIEHKAPYTFGEDGGYLVTTWLSPGRHRFTVRVTDAAGRRATDTVAARTGPTPAPPNALAHRWHRTVTAADQKKAGYDSPPPAGKWDIVIDRVGIWELDPLGGGTITEFSARPGVLKVYAPIQLAPDGMGVSRFGHTRIGGYECSPGGPFGSYAWAVSGSKLTLKGRNERCGGRLAILDGSWTRVG